MLVGAEELTKEDGDELNDFDYKIVKQSEDALSFELKLAVCHDQDIVSLYTVSIAPDSVVITPT